MPAVIAVATLMLLATTSAAAEQETFQDRVRKYGIVEELILTDRRPPLDLSGLVSDADLIVQVVVKQAHSIMGEQDGQVYTDYIAQVKMVLKGTTGDLKPDDTLQVRRRGGVAMVDGRMVLSQDTDFPFFGPGDEYVLFLIKRHGVDRYVLPDGAQGAFQVIRENVYQVSTMVGAGNHQHRVVTTDAFRELVRRQLTGVGMKE